MKKFFKPFIMAFLVVAVGASAVFCCCIEKLAQAQTHQNVVARACCHGDRAADHKNAKPCHCALTKFGIAEVEQGAFTMAAGISHAFHAPAVAMVGRSLFQAAVLRVAYGGAPPGRLSSVPLYLQQHSLRL